MDVGLKRHGRHGQVMLEHGMQADHLQVRVAEQTMYLLGLRRAMRNALRAQHLNA